MSCLKNPHLKVKGFYVGALKLNERIIAFIVTWMITPRGSNHVVLTEENLVLIYSIMKNIELRLNDYHLPSVAIISKFLQYFEVDLDEELSEVVKPTHKITNGSLSKMDSSKLVTNGLAKRKNGWDLLVKIKME